jgi:glycosyltransferase involved in cell wall biosynthesis
MSNLRVSCLMPICRAESEGLGSFMVQTVKDSELVGVALPGTNLRLNGCPSNFRFWMQKGETLGDARNQALEAARATIVCQWDSDDISHPDRLEMQLDAMTGHRACFLERITLLDVASGRKWLSHRYPWECTMMAEKSYVQELGGWPSLPKGEDTVLMRRMSRLSMKMLDAPELYTYRYHGGNTWDRDHFEMLCQLGSPL